MYNHVRTWSSSKGKNDGLTQPLLPTSDITSAPGQSAASFVKETPVPTTSKKPVRLVSLDAFRGFTLCMMVFVNYGGGGYNMLAHAPWNGLTFADLLFPWFVWMMGVSMAISLDSSLRRGGNKRAVWRALLIRSCKLFALGLFINNGFDLSNWRVPGVLQYFGVSGFLVGTVCIYVSSPLVQGVIFTSILGTFFAIERLLPINYPGYSCPTGYIGPGGIGSLNKYPECTGGAHRYVDYLLVGFHHMYHRLGPDGTVLSSATCSPMYRCAPYDPEGFLGMLSATVLCYLGYCGGRVLIDADAVKVKEDLPERFYKVVLPRYITVGCILCLLAGIMCGFSANDGYIPINKNLWSVSFIFCTGGLGFLLLSVFYFMVDIKKWWSGKPFFYVGMNSIVVYATSELISPYFPFSFQHPQVYEIVCLVFTFFIFPM